MRDIIMSIHPKWVRRIVSGEKKFELRKRPPITNEDYDAFIYETRPIMSITLCCRFAPALHGMPDDLWMEVKDKCCVEEHEYKTYFEGSKKAYAIPIMSKEPLIRYVPMNEIFLKYGVKAPQSWAYCSDDLSLFLRETMECSQ